MSNKYVESEINAFKYRVANIGPEQNKLVDRNTFVLSINAFKCSDAEDTRTHVTQDKFESLLYNVRSRCYK